LSSSSHPEIGSKMERMGDRDMETLVAHAREGGVWFDSRAWIVKARRP
jgi:hypothetical protein